MRNVTVTKKNMKAGESVEEKIKQAKQITQEKKKVNTEKSKNAER